jgi:hypothetical protein
MRTHLIWIAAATVFAAARASAAAEPLEAVQIPDSVSALRHSGVAPMTSPRHLFTRGDLVFGLAAAGLTTAAVSNDEWLTEESTEGNSPRERRLASLAQPLGSGALVFGALAAL